MNSTASSSFSDLPDDRMLLINAICNRFEQAHIDRQSPKIEDYLQELNDRERPAAIREMLPIEIEYLQAAGSTPTWKEYVSRFPSLDSQWVSQLLSSESVAKLKAQQAAAPGEEHPSRLGEYDILQPLGSGGMGTVYRAQHRRMKRVVALKVLKRELATSENLRKRFEREVQAAARLVHPNIVTAYDAGEDSGWMYLITEFIDGIDLNRHVRINGPMDFAAALHCVLGAAEGLKYAHEQQVIHRDIKPANLLIDQDAGVKILDMGLARLGSNDAEENVNQTDITKSGTFMGTATFMSPEQARNTRDADVRSDIYSLGCVFYFLLSGRPAFSGETLIDTIMLHATEPAPSLNDLSTQTLIPQQADQVFQRMVEKTPSDRYASVQEVLDALKPFASDGNAPRQTFQPASLASAVLLDAHDGSLDSVAETVAIEQATDSADSRHESAIDSADLRLPTEADVSNSQGARKRKRLPTSAFIACGTLGIVVAAFFLSSAIPKLFAPSLKELGTQPNATASGKSGANYAMQFDGESSYIVVESLRHNPNRSETFELILRPRSGQLSNPISWLGPDWMVLYFNQGRFGVGRLHQNQSILIEANAEVAMDQWVHVAGTWDGQQSALFIDGRLAEVSPNGFRLLPAFGGLFIGGCDPSRLPERNNRRYFSGDIDAVRISEGVRYKTDFGIVREFANDGNTLALYQFNDLESDQAIDSGSGKHHGRIVNAKRITVD